MERVELRFEDRADGAVAVYAKPRPAPTVTVVPPGTNGFIRGALRGLARERSGEADRDREPPFRLTRWDDGRLSLQDPRPAGAIELEAFGPTNEAAFARLLPARETARR